MARGWGSCAKFADSCCLATTAFTCTSTTIHNPSSPRAPWQPPQLVFEELGFRSFYSAPAPVFSMHRTAALMPHHPAARTGAGVVVDAGFSFTHVVPFFKGQVRKQQTGNILGMGMKMALEMGIAKH